VLLAVQTPLSAAVIVVDGDCTLADAIDAANTDAPAGACPAGSGLDEIQLTSDVLLTEVDNENREGPNGLPEIVSDLEIDGRGFEIRRDASAP